MFKNNPQRFFAMASEGRGGGDANDLPEIKVEEHAEREPSSRWREFFKITIGEQHFLLDNHKEYDDRRDHMHCCFEIYEKSLRTKIADLSFTDSQKDDLYGAVLGAIYKYITTDKGHLTRAKNPGKLRVHEIKPERRLSHHTLQ